MTDNKRHYRSYLSASLAKEIHPMTDNKRRYRSYLSASLALALVLLLCGAVVLDMLSDDRHGHDQPEQIQTAAELQALAEDRVVNIGGHREEIPNMEQLIEQADLVIVGHVTGQGKTYTIEPPVDQPGDRPLAEQQVTEQQAQDEIDKSMPELPSGVTLPDVPSLPITEFSIRVMEVVKGAGAAGDRVSIAQVGGQVLLPTFEGGPMLKRTIVTSYDPLMQTGQPYLLFLTRGEDGIYGIVGGAQGRYTIDQQGTLQPIVEGTELGRSLGGKNVKNVVADMRANKR